MAHPIERQTVANSSPHRPEHVLQASALPYDDALANEESGGQSYPDRADDNPETIVAASEDRRLFDSEVQVQFNRRF